MTKAPFHLLALALLAAGCGPDGKDPIKTEEHEPLEFAVTSVESVSGIDSKLSDGDEVSVFAGYNASENLLNVLFTAEKGGSVLTTKVKRAKEQKTNVALFPYSSASSYDETSGEVSLNLPYVQNHVEGGVAPGLLPLVASSKDKSLSFKQVCGIFRISLSGSATINSIEVESVKIAGAGSVDASTAEIRMSDNASDKIQYKFAAPVALGATAKDFNIVLPPGTYSTIYYIVYAEDGSQMSAYEENVTIGRGTETVAAKTEYVADKSDAGRVDLSAMGAANCYVVNGAGEYAFDCTMPDATKTVVSGSGVTWVWATSGSWTSQEQAKADAMVTDIAYDQENNRITFTVPDDFCYGNILLALLDDKGFVAYSWHIWLTQRLTEVTIAGLSIMDRNLGAAAAFDLGSSDINATKNARGLTYQWARKDPAPGSLTTSEVEDGTKNPICSPGITTYYATNSGINQVTAFPNDENKLPWTCAVPSYFDKEEGHEYTPGITNAGQFPCTFINGQANHPAHGLAEWPTEASPCPIGYHVMTTSEFNSIKSDASFTASPIEDKESGEKAVVLTSVLVFPATGYRNLGKLTGPSVDGRIWMNDRPSGVGSVNNGYWVQIGSGYENCIKEGAANKLHSASVRCVKD